MAKSVLSLASQLVDDIQAGLSWQASTSARAKQVAAQRVGQLVHGLLERRRLKRIPTTARAAALPT
jgi:hypothetical protein